ncbi:MAG: MBL fold metallo-hydrolase [Nakamurella sp.]
MWTLQLWGHSCVSITVPDSPQGSARLLLDPGDLTPPLDDVGPVDAVLVTHAHPDHFDLDQIHRIGSSGVAPIYGPVAVVDQLAAAGVGGGSSAESRRLDIRGVQVDTFPAPHEVIHPELPVPQNVAYWIGERLLAPGDSFLVPAFDVDTLLLPIGAPWLKLSESVDYLRAVSPRRAVLVHGAGLATPHRLLARRLITELAPAGTTVIDPVVGEPVGLQD